MNIGLIITAGGESKRYGRNKLLEKVKGREVIIHTIEGFDWLSVTELVIVGTEETVGAIKPLLKSRENIKYIRGGGTRQESVFNGLKAMKKVDMVLIHDGARPIVDPIFVKNCLKKAISTKACVPGIKISDTIKKINSEEIIERTINREILRRVQTPQIFEYKLILEAHQRFQGKSFSDDAGMLEALGVKVSMVNGDYKNIKITTPTDLKLVELYMTDK